MNTKIKLPHNRSPPMHGTPSMVHGLTVLTQHLQQHCCGVYTLYI